jgi:hypothetical protein
MDGRKWPLIAPAGVVVVVVVVIVVVLVVVLVLVVVVVVVVVAVVVVLVVLVGGASRYMCDQRRSCRKTQGTFTCVCRPSESAKSGGTFIRFPKYGVVLECEPCTSATMSRGR